MKFHELAGEIVARGIAYAADKEWPMVVVVIDSSFGFAAGARMDGTYPSSFPVAQAKAHTALNFGASIDALKERIAQPNQFQLMSVEPRLIFLRGGAPLVVDGQPIGAVGVSGGNEAQDAECLEAAIAGI